MKDREPRTGEGPDRRFAVRVASVFVRAVHLLAAAVVAGAVLLGISDSRLPAWWIAAAASGVLLLLAELSRRPTLVREVAGVSTLAKLLLIGLIPAWPAAAPWLMAGAFVVAVLGAHFPRGWRHFRLS